MMQVMTNGPKLKYIQLEIKENPQILKFEKQQLANVDLEFLKL